MTETLGDEDLFRYRTIQDKTVPAKGGQKDFLPDGSWLQNKHIENFHQERERVLAEPRVQRKGDYVQGTWNREKQLVQLTKEMRNFWEVMGFSADKRLWLHPEEALFLVETNVLQVWCEGLPMSIQEAYSVMLQGARMLDFYQVYAHLRRIGYVVIRHQGRCNFTKYERQIGLDKVSSKAARKRKQKDEKLSKSKSSQPSEQSIDGQKSGAEAITDQNLEDTKCELAKCEIPVTSVQMDTSKASFEVCDTDKVIKEDTNEASMDINEVPEMKEGTIGISKESVSISVKASDTVDTVTNSGNATAQMEQDMEVDSTELTKVKPDKGFISDSVTFEEGNQKSKQRKYHYPIASWNYNEIKFPDFSAADDSVVVSQPNAKYTPGVQPEQDSYIFIKKQYVNTKKVRARDLKDDRNLKFSNQNAMTGKLMSGKTCKNWTEYKAALNNERKNWSRKRNLPHLYTSDLCPLVNPENANTTAELLSQLQVIEEDRTSISSQKPPVLPDFDVYTPNTKFRKSSPGTPDFRILISRTTDAPPDLLVQTSISAYLNDDIPLQCAVVDYGNVAFFSFNDLALPIDISLS